MTYRTTTTHSRGMNGGGATNPRREGGHKDTCSTKKTKFLNSVDVNGIAEALVTTIRQS
jgi:hypothetical protein